MTTVYVDSTLFKGPRAPLTSLNRLQNVPSFVELAPASGHIRLDLDSQYSSKKEPEAPLTEYADEKFSCWLFLPNKDAVCLSEWRHFPRESLPEAGGIRG